MHSPIPQVFGYRENDLAPRELYYPIANRAYGDQPSLLGRKLSDRVPRVFQPRVCFLPALLSCPWGQISDFVSSVPICPCTF